ncbi:hypothetical protein BU26DRAFT_558297 [Trematosphaeria pertusa]|uniref:Uncharacterized protein n=1 Tax=Trematosphaeria pertusa TaxID=390896 RepID=A0A6A6J2B7_9PLEO|nr:uncharacterized protein BU26DRAFT_558297 [Trematosphaeria pertusa]KAF2256859.1 hypothetical protein BU26DRAFT_558297 [Trematosphaeria pertusa]
MSRLKTSLSFLFLLLASTPLVLAAPQPPQPAPAREVAANEVITQPRQQVPGSTGTADTPSPTNTTGSAELASVFVCEHVYWGGTCSIVTAPLDTGECTPLDGSASSIGPDPGFTCTFYKNGSCRDFTGSDALTLENPGSPNLLDTPKGNFNDVVRGFTCSKTTTS